MSDNWWGDNTTKDRTIQINNETIPPPPPSPKPRKSRVILLLALCCAVFLVTDGIIGYVLIYYHSHNAPTTAVYTNQPSGTSVPTAIPTPVNASFIARSYYQAIESQDYTKAYSYLARNMQTTSGQALTLDVFTTGATAEDTSLGTVTNIAQTGISTSNGTASITMSITRNGQSYVVHLELQQINGNWVITQFDKI